MTYHFAYYLNVGVAIVGVIAGVLAGVGYAGQHPSWLTTDVSATAGIVSAICVGLAALLPQLSRTPAGREAKYLRARSGHLPRDLARKHHEPEEPPHG